METFAQRVLARRKALGLTQGQLADLSGLKQPDISKIEKGRIQQTVEIIGLAKALQCNAHWLQTGDGDMHHGVNEFAALLNQMAVVIRHIPPEDRESACAKAVQALVSYLPDFGTSSSARPSPLGQQQKQS